MAEGVGFEPTRACALPVFKTGAINHSTTPPSFDGEYCATDSLRGKVHHTPVAAVYHRRINWLL